MNRPSFLLVFAVVVGAVATGAPSFGADDDVAPVYGVKLPDDYRDWKLISVARVGGSVNDLRAKLGNEVALKAYREGKLPQSP